MAGDFAAFIRGGGGRSIVLTNRQPYRFERKQAPASTGEIAAGLIEGIWTELFNATTAAILRTEPTEFSASGLADLDQDALRGDALQAVLRAVESEGIDLATPSGKQRALTVLAGIMNQAQQEAMGIEFYVWVTQGDIRVRPGHAERSGVIFRWDDPPEGGHPTQDYGCRCYAKALSIEGYWKLVGESVATFSDDVSAMEGVVNHMYQDTVGNVTIGIGTRLFDATQAAGLPFQRRNGGAPASQTEIETEYALIDGLTANGRRGASYYEPYTELVLPNSELDRLFALRVREFFDPMLRLFPDFGNFPVSVQVALWDLIYNLGPGGLEGFPNLRRAIAAEDWEEAARESSRSDIGPERNRYVFDLFLDAVD